MGNKTSCDHLGIILPCINVASLELQVTMYMLIMLNLFIAIAVASDVFMTAIEEVTSKTYSAYVIRKKRDSNSYQVWIAQVPRWNRIIASLTLMAFGSSAPEIVLSMYDTWALNFQAGDLGVGTIIGSAAYNLLIISFICMISLPKVSGFFGVFAYIWLVLILTVITPNVVDLWEALATLLFFPISTYFSFAVEYDFCGFWTSRRKIRFEDGDDWNFDISGRDEVRLANFIREIKGYGLTDEEAQFLAEMRIPLAGQDHGLKYKINSKRRAMSRRTIYVEENLAFVTRRSLIHPSITSKEVVVRFTRVFFTVKETIGRCPIFISRHGNKRGIALVRVYTISGSAKAGVAFTPLDLLLEFKAKERRKRIDVEIKHNSIWEPTERFYLRLAHPPGHSHINIGVPAIAEVTKINIIDPEVIQFRKERIVLPNTTSSIYVKVVRLGSKSNHAQVDWVTRDSHPYPIQGVDYLVQNTPLHFVPHQKFVYIPVKIIGRQDRQNMTLYIDLIREGPQTFIGVNKTIAITVTNDPIEKKPRPGCKPHLVAWKVQFIDAVCPSGADGPPRWYDYLLHVLTIVWKVLLAFAPPPSLLGGWLSFLGSLFFMGLFTALLRDAAEVLGCLLGMNNGITAITLVAVGTSLPDTCASRIACLRQKTADDAIGNINGSNSVNVFVGLGLPWLWGAIYHLTQGTDFRQDSRGIQMSVIIFSVVVFFVVTLFTTRRCSKSCGFCELGGPTSTRYASAAILFFLWIVYISTSSLFIYYDMADSLLGIAIPNTGK